MSKISKILIALLASSFIAAPAFAITADFTGFLQSRGIAYDNLDGDDDLDDNARGVDTRFRLWTNAALNENVKAVFALEVDYAWGKQAQTAGLTGAGEVGSIGADAKSQIEIKQIYLDFNIPTLNTNVKAGTQYTSLADGLILAGDDTTGVTVRYTPVKGQSVALYWVKTGEKDKFDDSDDSDYYHLQYDLDVAGWRISPMVGYYALEDVAAGGGNEALFYGVSASGKVGNVALSATVVGNDWEYAGVGEGDGNSIAALVKASYKLNSTTLTAEGGWYGDEDNADGAFFGVRPYNNFAEIVTGGRFDGRGTIGSNQTVTAASTASAPYEANWLYGKLGVDQKLSDTTKVSAFYIYAEEAEDSSATVDARTIGHEIDAYLDHTVVKGLTFTLGGGYLIADDDFGDGDDAWKAGTALTYTF